MSRYNPNDLELKWQKIWADDNRYRAIDGDEKPKYYVSEMFPYPSGAGMHVGHFFGHSIVDAIARFRRSLGYNVLYPMGWDSFGLPAENYAIKTGKKPQDTTKQNIDNFRRQFKRVGSSIDWEREINTSDPEYYRWTQWVFTKLFDEGLAYQRESLQWWCPKDKTVLANEQVVNGRCWRCDTVVVKKSMKQWFFKITDYADELLEEIPALDWPTKIKVAQTNWIGRSEGAEVEFQVDGTDDSVTVFTTRPDTIFGATFLVIAPEHRLATVFADRDETGAVQSYIDEAVKRTDIERTNQDKEKTGVFSGVYAINPGTGEKIPIWIADYVLIGYGTGAIMAVPAHDERDFAFANKFGIDIRRVVTDDSNEEFYAGEGKLQNSGRFDGMESSEAREQIVAWLEDRGVGVPKVTYKMRDWLISRQRYWGAPIPIIHCPEHGAVPVPEDQLPVLLPDVDDFEPKGDGKSPLARVESWVKTTCPICGSEAHRETDVMDGYAWSSWYLLRFIDPHDAKVAWDPKLSSYWTPVDTYVGGDHAVAHLLYVRFWNHFFYKSGLVPTKEPIKKLVYHGLINAEDGKKMSKSVGNVVDPLDVIDSGYGADTLRVFLLFLGPVNENSNWDSHGIAGVYRFLNRFWTLVDDYLAAQDDAHSDATSEAELNKLLHGLIRKVTDDYNRLSFNTAIASCMEFINALYQLKTAGFKTKLWGDVLATFAQLIAPLAPHIAAETWQKLGNDDAIDFHTWPIWDENLIVSKEMTIVVQVNGKLRAKLVVASDISEELIKKSAVADENVRRHLNGEPKKVIYVKNKLVSIVT